tara:strand:+ start:117 stop:473 length:357 start_codon:yes stop_codon:yes gene_type:complete
MLYYTEKTNIELRSNYAVQRDSSNNLVEHTDGTVVGICMSCFEIQDTNPVFYESKIYVSGGGGQSMILNSNWSGLLTRFEFVNGKVEPVDTGGSGWLVPEYPQVNKNAGDIVSGVIYR